MLNTVMSWVKVQAWVIVVTAAAATAVEANDLSLGRSLDATGLTNNHTDLTVSENDIVDDQWELMAERRKSCSPTTLCTLASGFCVKARADCNGTVDPSGCRGGRKCKCCIPDQSTPTPVTCPIVTCTPCPAVTSPPVTTYTTIATTTEENTYSNHTAIACEHGSELYIECKAGNLINLSYANYGRLSVKFCNSHGQTTTNCKSSTSMKEVAARCSGKVSCNVAASNAIFGDPCGGIYKYLEVHYTCEPPQE